MEILESIVVKNNWWFKTKETNIIKWFYNSQETTEEIYRKKLQNV